MPFSTDAAKRLPPITWAASSRTSRTRARRRQRPRFVVHGDESLLELVGRRIESIQCVHVQPPIAEAGARFKITLGMCLMTVVLTYPAITSAQDAVSNAVSCLAAKQNPDGSWGAADGTQLRQTSTVLDAFTAVAPLSPMGATISQGAAFLNSAAAPNQDDLARQIATLSQASVSPCGGLIPDDACAPGGIKAGYLVATLLQGQESETQDLTRADYPAGAWGVGSKYASEALTTALALAGVQNAGVPTGLAVVQALVQAGTPLVHQFNLPADASNLTLLIRSVTGTVRLHIQTPSSGTFTTDLTNISTPSTLNGLPAQAGPYVLTVESLAGSPNSYSLEARYATTDVDVGQVSRALSYLGFAQNLDGSWGIRRGESGLVVTTAAAVQTLQRYGASFAPAGALSAGASWLASAPECRRRLRRQRRGEHGSGNRTGHLGDRGHAASLSDPGSGQDVPAQHPRGGRLLERRPVCDRSGPPRPRRSRGRGHGDLAGTPDQAEHRVERPVTGQHQPDGASQPGAPVHADNRPDRHVHRVRHRARVPTTYT